MLPFCELKLTQGCNEDGYNVVLRVKPDWLVHNSRKSTGTDALIDKLAQLQTGIGYGQAPDGQWITQKKAVSTRIGQA
ncbi:MAG: hypothetical protein P8M25_07900 [Paracoccaceae bacterium]|nr:hypothetical protein [Paracoccaceae bacterium]